MASPSLALVGPFDHNATRLILKPLLEVLSKGIHDLTILVPLFLGLLHNSIPACPLNADPLKVGVELFIIGLRMHLDLRPVL